MPVLVCEIKCRLIMPRAVYDKVRRLSIAIVNFQRWQEPHIVRNKIFRQSIIIIIPNHNNLIIITCWNLANLANFLRSPSDSVSLAEIAAIDRCVRTRGTDLFIYLFIDATRSSIYY